MRFLFSLLAVFSLTVSSFAVDVDVSDSGSDDGGSVDVGQTLEEVGQVFDSVSDLVDQAIPEDSAGELAPEVSQGGNSFYILSQPADDPDVNLGDLTDIPVGAMIDDISVFASVSPVGPGDTSGLKAALLSVLGDYDPVIVEYRYSSSSGSSQYLREVQPDYVWLCSCGLLALVIYCLFRLGGAVFRD